MADQQPAFAQPIDKKDLYVLRSFVDSYLSDMEWVPTPQLATAYRMRATLDEAIAKAEAEVKEWKAGEITSLAVRLAMGREKWLELQAKRDRLRARYPHLSPTDD